MFCQTSLRHSQEQITRYFTLINYFLSVLTAPIDISSTINSWVFSLYALSSKPAANGDLDAIVLEYKVPESWFLAEGAETGSKEAAWLWSSAHDFLYLDFLAFASSVFATHWPNFTILSQLYPHIWKASEKAVMLWLEPGRWSSQQIEHSSIFRCLGRKYSWLSIFTEWFPHDGSSASENSTSAAPWASSPTHQVSKKS